MRRLTLLLRLIALAGLAGVSGHLSGANSAPPRGPAESSWDKYRVVATRNIFLRDRSRPPIPRAAAEAKSAESVVTATGMVLTGVGQSGGIRVAVLEDLRNEKIIQSVAGEIIDGGCVVEVGMDGIVYERRGVTRRIALGQDLSGQAVSDFAPATQPATGVAGVSASQPASGGAPAGVSELERKMRERRARE